MKNTKDNIHFDGGSSFLIWGTGKTSGSRGREECHVTVCDWDSQFCRNFPIINLLKLYDVAEDTADLTSWTKCV